MVVVGTVPWGNVFAESHRLEDEIRKQLLSIGIGIE